MNDVKPRIDLARPDPLDDPKSNICMGGADCRLPSAARLGLHMRVRQSALYSATADEPVKLGRRALDANL